MEVSKETFEEIAQALMAAGYEHALHESREGRVIDMHGIGLQMKKRSPGIEMNHTVIDDPMDRSPNDARGEIEKGAGGDYPIINTHFKITV